MAGERWPTAVVRRSGWQVGATPIFYVTLVLDDVRAAGEFEQWLVRNAPRRKIRRYGGPAGGDKANALYVDVPFHGGGLASRIDFCIHTLRRYGNRHWLETRQLALRAWLRLRS